MRTLSIEVACTSCGNTIKFNFREMPTKEKFDKLLKQHDWYVGYITFGVGPILSPDILDKCPRCEHPT